MKRTIAFLKYRYIAFGVSILFLVSFTATTIMKGGLNMGVDFVGGMKIIAKFEQGVNEEKIRKSLAIYNPMVQQIDDEEKNEYIISARLKKEEKKAKKTPGKKNKKDSKKSEKRTLVDTKKKTMSSDSDLLIAALNKSFKKVEILSVENVGPAIGDFLKKEAAEAFIVALILMAIYLTFRFEFKYSIGALAALIHDITITIVFCGFAGVEINIPVIAAVLTIFGYSVNDTIVIFDRIRENDQVKSKSAFLEIINKSISQSLSRTLLTSLTTLFAVLALYLIGGEGLNEFALILLFGIFIGTYSSVYIASPALLAWENLRSK